MFSCVEGTHVESCWVISVTVTTVYILSLSVPTLEISALKPLFSGCWGIVFIVIHGHVLFLLNILRGLICFLLFLRFIRCLKIRMHHFLA